MKKIIFTILCVVSSVKINEICNVYWFPNKMFDETILSKFQLFSYKIVPSKLQIFNISWLI